MKKLKILNFQNLKIENAEIIKKPLFQDAEQEDDILSVVFVREPYEYFDALLFDYLFNQKSLLFSQDIIKHMKELGNDAFLEWLDSMNFVPFYNPQTYWLDHSKRPSIAIEMLECFDYVVPYENIRLFLEHVPSDIMIAEKTEKKLVFSLESQRQTVLADAFIEKDMKLYERSLELWDRIKRDGYRPLQLRKEILERQKSPAKKRYQGVAGRMTARELHGWVFDTKNDRPVEIAVYRNGELLSKVKADKKREDLIKQNIHTTGECGFEVSFDKPIFKRGDSVEVMILPDKVLLKLGTSVRDFLEK